MSPTSKYMQCAAVSTVFVVMSDPPHRNPRPGVSSFACKRIDTLHAKCQHSFRFVRITRTYLMFCACLICWQSTDNLWFKLNLFAEININHIIIFKINAKVSRRFFLPLAAELAIKDKKVIHTTRDFCMLHISALSH